MNKKILVLPLILSMLIGIIPIAYSLSDVDTSASSSATAHSNMRLTTYDNGYWWVFYNNGVDMVYRSSTSGLVWGAETFVSASTNFMSIWNDQSIHELTYLKLTNGGDHFKWRKGTLNDNGIITWINTEQSVTTATDVQNDGYIMKTFIGTPYLFVCVNEEVAGSERMNVYRYDIDADTWTSTPIFSYVGFSNLLACNILQTTNGLVLSYPSIRGDTGSPILIRTSIDSGDTWSAPVSPVFDYTFRQLSIVARADKVHYVGINTGGTNIRHFSYIAGDPSTSSETILATASIPSVQLSKHESSFLQVFYAVGTTDIRSVNSTDNGLTWGTPIVQTSGEQTPRFVQSIYQHFEKSGASWTDVPIFTVRFDDIVLGVPALVTAIDEFNLIDSLLAFQQNLRVLTDVFNLTDTITDTIEGIGLFFEDTFHLTERLQVIFDVTIKILVDAFQLVDSLIPSTPDQELGTPIPNRQISNPSLFYSGTFIGNLITTIAMPFAVLFSLLLFANKINILAGVIVIPVFVFSLLMLIFIGLIPNWIIILILLMVAGLVTSIVNKLTGGNTE